MHLFIAVFEGSPNLNVDSTLLSHLTWSEKSPSTSAKQIDYLTGTRWTFALDIDSVPCSPPFSYNAS